MQVSLKAYETHVKYTMFNSTLIPFCYATEINLRNAPVPQWPWCHLSDKQYHFSSAVDSSGLGSSDKVF